MSRIVSFALLCMLAVPCSAQRHTATTDEAALRQIEHTWVDAFLHKDQAALGRILADDWAGQYPWGNENRDQALAALVSTRAHIDSLTLGPMHVRIFGDVAFIQGTDDERSSFAGKDTSGHYSWTDIFVRRKGRWVAVASQLTLVRR